MMSSPAALTVTPEILQQLAPTGVLRAGINLSNFLLVTGRTPTDDPVGVAPDMAQAIADHLGVTLRLVPFDAPGLLADAAVDKVWDIGLIGAEPKRAEHIAFSTAYVEIEATYLVWENARFKTVSDLDAPGVRIAVSERTAYDLWLVRNIHAAELVHRQGFDAAKAAFVDGHLDALACLRPALLKDVQEIAGTRIIDGQFTAIQQAIGTHRGNEAAAAFLQAFSQHAIRSGLVASLIAKHHVQGLSVAPVAALA